MQEKSKQQRKTHRGSVDPGALALFVSGSPQGVDAGLLQKLASTADFVLAVDSGAEQLKEAEIVPDLLLGDLDSISAATLGWMEQIGVPVQSFNPYKNATDVELGIEELAARGYRRCIATNVLGGRADHALGSIGTLAGAAHDGAMEIVIRDTQEICYFVSSNAKQRTVQLHFDHSPSPGAPASAASSSPGAPASAASSSPGAPASAASSSSGAPASAASSSPGTPASAASSSHTLPPESQSENRKGSVDTQLSSPNKEEAAEQLLRLADEKPLLVSPPRPKYISLISWGGSVIVSIRGTEWELDHHSLSPYSALGISNVLSSSALHFEVHSGDGVALLLFSYTT